MKIIKKSVLAVLVLSMVLALASCGNKDTLEGTWGYTESNVEYSYVFNKDGTGTMNITADISLSFQYTVKDNKVSITSTMLGMSQTDEYEYTLKGKKLTLKNGDTTVELEKK